VTSSSTAGRRLLSILVVITAALASGPCFAQAARPAQPAQSKPPPDLSGRTRVGVASFYADRFAGRQMANGAPMNPYGNNAASRTLPLGTTARVTNLETGRSAVVRIEDRGPYVKGRIVDLSPSTARKIGITPRKGISKVAVAPIAVPLPDGRIKPGDAARGIRVASAERPSRR
jgi:rare lipoprotein A